jgi:hypothetical protein
MRQLFAIGQAVTQVNNKIKYQVQPGNVLCGKTHSYGPKSGEVVHVSQYEEENGDGYITFVEYPPIGGSTYWYFQDEFAPVVSDSVLEKELEEIFSGELEVKK